MNYQTAYEPPAPFSFKILNKDLNSIEGKSFELQVESIGDVIPENAQIYFNNESYFLKDKGNGLFSFRFENLKESLEFFIASNEVNSRPYTINVIKTPSITEFLMVLDYPNYTNKRNEIIKNTGNAIIPEGTLITWNINTEQTDSVHLISTKNLEFQSTNEQGFSLRKRILKSLNYQISTSNENLKVYEQLSYTIQVINDEYPQITVKSDIDSVSRGPIQFAGQLSDDYGLSKLNLVYYELENEKEIKKHPIEIKKQSFEEFYYLFVPEGELELDAGKDYELYFEVF